MCKYVTSNLLEPELKVEVKSELSLDFEQEQKSCVIQTYIQQEPLDIKQEVEEPLDIQQEVEEPLDIREEVEDPLDIQQEVEEPFTNQCDPALAQLSEIEKTKRIKRKRKSKVKIVPKPLEPPKPVEAPPVKKVVKQVVKHIQCFVCFDKFSSNLTFEMHNKLMHKNKT